jgi:hypothetical protein
MPKLDFLSNAAPSAFVCPPKTEPPVETAVLSSTATTKATKKKKEQETKTQDEAAAAASAMAVDEKAAVAATVETEAEVALLAHPARVVRPQLPKIAFPASARFQPVRAVS